MNDIKSCILSKIERMEWAFISVGNIDSIFWLDFLYLEVTCDIFDMFLLRKFYFLECWYSN